MIENSSVYNFFFPKLILMSTNKYELLKNTL